MIKTITLIGAGNLATQIGVELRKSGIQILQVYSRTEESAIKLAQKLDSGYTIVPTEINLECDLLIVAIKDDAISEIISLLDLRNTFIVHTAGSVPMNLLADYSSHYGVFYPLQTFTKGRELNFSEIPFCLESNTAEGLLLLKELASKVSDQIHEINSEERQALHLAAVFACNFVNHFYNIADELIADKQLDFDMLRPLIKETAAKVNELKPADSQTGPAVRFDETIINKHLKMLDGREELRKIYSFVSENIHQTYKK